MASNVDIDFKQTEIPIPAKMMHLHIPDLQSLYNSYMPFLEHGGLFIPTEEQFSLGDEILLALSVGKSQDKKFIRTNVAWINFARSTTTRPKGIGVAFGKDEVGITTKNQIEKQLGTALRGENTTFTL
ncbi:MAG: pilus assembly protein [Neisseria sp.]|nr:pilus assembly protein [Neisseria sp.]